MKVSSIQFAPSSDAAVESPLRRELSPRITMDNWSVEVDSIKPESWSADLKQFRDASVYQTWAFGEVSWGRRQLSHLVVKNKGETIGMAQLRVVRLPFCRCGVAYVRWGPLWRRKGEEADLRKLEMCLRAIKEEFAINQKLLLRILLPLFEHEPEADRVRDMLVGLGFTANQKFKPYHTAIIDLSSTLEEIRSAFHQRWRNYLRAAERAGIEVKVDTSDEAYGDFLRAYDEMMSRKRFATGVNVRGFARIHSVLSDPCKFRIFRSFKHGALLNALVISAMGETGIYLLAGTAHAGLEEKGAHLLQWKAIEWLKSAGFRYYDLGGMNKDINPGVYQFKNAMGGHPTSLIGCYEFHPGSASKAAVNALEFSRGLVANLKGIHRKFLPSRP